MTDSPPSQGRDSNGSSGVMMRTAEEVIRLGEGGHLVGILGLPEASDNRDPPAVIILNAGVLHRVGPHRLHVKLSRQLAARGFPTLRLDLSGIGDSPSVPGGLTFRESSVNDTRAAMDHLGQRIGARRFVIFGVCSGADNGLATAAVDERVCGLALVDPPSYVTTRSRVRAELDRARRLKTPGEALAWGGQKLGRVGNRLGALGRRVAGVVQGADVSAANGEPGRLAPPIGDYRTTLTELVERGVRVLAVFSGALHERYNHEDQIFELFPELRGRLDRAYFPDANHTFTELASQTRLLSTVVGWVDRLT